MSLLFFIYFFYSSFVFLLIFGQFFSALGPLYPSLTTRHNTFFSTLYFSHTLAITFHKISNFCSSQRL
jgi:hypothetical protein